MKKYLNKEGTYVNLADMTYKDIEARIGYWKGMRYFLEKYGDRDPEMVCYFLKLCVEVSDLKVELKRLEKIKL